MNEAEVKAGLLADLVAIERWVEAARTTLAAAEPDWRQVEVFFVGIRGMTRDGAAARELLK